MKPRRATALYLLAWLGLLGSACSADDSSTLDGSAADVQAADLGSADAGLDATDALAADLAPDSPPVVLPELGDLTMFINLGDSIAAGFGVTHAYRDLLMGNDDQVYPDYAGKDLRDRYPELQLVDRAQSGATSLHVVSQAQMAPPNPEGNTLVVLSVGGNDLLSNYTALFDAAQLQQVAQAVTGNIKKILAAFGDKARYPGDVFVLAFNVFEMTDGQGTIPDDEPVIDICDRVRAVGPLLGDGLVQNFDAFNAALEALYAADGALLIDVHQAFLGHGFNYKDSALPHYDADDPTLWFRYDCLHPNNRGHHEIRRLIWRRLFGE